MTTANWCKKISTSADLNKLQVFARKRMLTSEWVGNNTYPLIAKNSRYWQWSIDKITDDTIQAMITEIQEQHNIPLRFDGSYLSLWEYGEGDSLSPHIDPDISQSASVVIALIGRFEVRLNDNDTEEILDRIQYSPGEGIILNNTKFKHSGECLDGYRLCLLLSVDKNYNGEFFK